MKRINWNQNWIFYNDIKNQGEQLVDLPHDAMLTERRLQGMKNGAAAGFFPGGRYVYRKNIWGAEEYCGKSIYLEFEGIYMKSSVYLNGVRIGGWIYGYTGFYVDLTDKLKIGEDNEIRVVADNSQTPNSRWYTGSGIYRDVYLLVGNKKHIHPNGVRVITESCEPAVVHITAEMTEEAGECGIETRIYEILEHGNTRLVAKGEGTDFKVEIPDAKLWDAEHPNLYRVRVTLKDGEETVDEQEITTGIRTLAWDSQHGLQVNGRETKLRGGCIHHDNGILGACAHKKAEFRKARILKKAGFNAIRSAHNPISKSMLEACDKIGLYVMDEAFDQWKMKKTDYDYGLYFEEEWEKDLKAMIQKDFNHPCVIIYSIGNEIADTGSIEGAKISRMLSSFCHSLDATRPTLNAINPVVSNMGGAMNNSRTSKEDTVNPYEETKNAQATASLLANMIATAAPIISKMMGKPEKVEKLLKPCFNEVDIAGYNYAERCYGPHHEWAPDRIMAGAETYPQTLAARWPQIERSPYIIGDFMWTAMDYLGEAGVGVPIYGRSRGGFNRPYPCISGGCGVIDLIGHMETEAYHASIAWGQYKKTYIAVRPLNHSGEKYFFGAWRGTDAVSSWSWTGMEGKRADIEVYSSGKQIELFQDGVSLGKQNLLHCRAEFQTIYKPGELEAVSYDEQGRELSRVRLKSASDEIRLEVKAEEQVLQADISDMTFVSAALTDAQGIVKMLVDREIQVRVSGAGRLVGIGSGRPVTEESFTGDSYTTWFGRMGFYIRSTGETGKAYIDVSAEGVESKKLEIIFK